MQSPLLPVDGCKSPCGLEMSQGEIMNGRREQTTWPATSIIMGTKSWCCRVEPTSPLHDLLTDVLAYAHAMSFSTNGDNDNTIVKARWDHTTQHWARLICKTISSNVTLPWLRLCYWQACLTKGGLPSVMGQGHTPWVGWMASSSLEARLRPCACTTALYWTQLLSKPRTSQLLKVLQFKVLCL